METYKKIWGIYGEGAINNRQGRNWFVNFCSEDTSLEDEPILGQPSHLNYHWRIATYGTVLGMSLTHDMPSLRKCRQSNQARK